MFEENYVSGYNLGIMNTERIKSNQPVVCYSKNKQLSTTLILKSWLKSHIGR